MMQPGSRGGARCVSRAAALSSCRAASAMCVHPTARPLGLQSQYGLATVRSPRRRRQLRVQGPNGISSQPTRHLEDHLSSLPTQSQQARSASAAGQITGSTPCLRSSCCPEEGARTYLAQLLLSTDYQVDRRATRCARGPVLDVWLPVPVAWTLGLSDHLNIHLPMNLMTGLGRSACGENHEGGREQLMKR